MQMYAYVDYMRNNGDYDPAYVFEEGEESTLMVLSIICFVVAAPIESGCLPLPCACGFVQIFSAPTRTFTM